LDAADWISSIIGPLWAHRAVPWEFGQEQWAEKYLARRLDAAATHSAVKIRNKSVAQISLRLPPSAAAPSSKTDAI
jgi:hypothetical protein